MNETQEVRLLYAEEHLSCFNYSKQNPLIKILKKETGDIFEINPPLNTIIFILNGKITLSSGLVNGKIIEEGKMFVHPNHTKGIVHVVQSCTMIVMVLNTNLSFCEHFSFEKLCRENINKQEEDIFSLDINPVAGTYLISLESYINQGLRCVYFFELKLKEFLYILRAYYTKEDLRDFFYPILNKDMEFSIQVFENRKKAKTVKELAEILNYSTSGFEKRFKKVFDISASKWLEQDRARSIYHEINCSNKTITEIAYDFQLSPPQFNDYCKRIFRKTPNQLRKQHSD